MHPRHRVPVAQPGAGPRARPGAPHRTRAARARPARHRRTPRVGDRDPGAGGIGGRGDRSGCHGRSAAHDRGRGIAHARRDARDGAACCDERMPPSCAPDTGPRRPAARSRATDAGGPRVDVQRRRRRRLGAADGRRRRVPDRAGGRDERPATRARRHPHRRARARRRRPACGSTCATTASPRHPLRPATASPGMRERAALLGGTCEAGPRPERRLGRRPRRSRARGGRRERARAHRRRPGPRAHGPADDPRRAARHRGRRRGRRRRRSRRARAPTASRCVSHRHPDAGHRRPRGDPPARRPRCRRSDPGRRHHDVRPRRVRLRGAARGCARIPPEGRGPDAARRGGARGRARRRAHRPRP